MAELKEPKWYVIHTYSGYENKVMGDIEKTVKNRNIQDLICELHIPEEEYTEIKSDGTKKTGLRKKYPCYVFVKMILTDETWYLVRNTRGVTSFVGTDYSKPQPLTDAEVRFNGLEKRAVVSFSHKVGDSVFINDGPFMDSTGIVKEINLNKKTVVVNISIFGRETPVELDFSQISSIE